MSTSHDQLAAILAKLEPEDRLMLQAMKILLLDPILKRIDSLETEIKELKGQVLVTPSAPEKDKPSPPPVEADDSLSEEEPQKPGPVAITAPPPPPPPAPPSNLWQRPDSEEDQYPFFAGAGDKPGIEAWRIEGRLPERVPDDQWGKFFKKDAYLVLSTEPDKKVIHYWVGSEVSSDKESIGAILAVQLNGFACNKQALVIRNEQGV